MSLVGRSMLCFVPLASWLVVGTWFSGVAYCQGSNLAAAGDDWHFRYDLFQMLLEEQGLKVLAEPESAWASPTDSVVVITGRLPRQFFSSDWERLVNFVQTGGTLMLASDNTMQGPGFGQFFSGPVTTANPADQYQGFPDCLQISRTVDAASLFPGVSRVVTNRSGWFVPNPIGWLNWTPLAALPKDCRPTASRNQAVLAIGRSTSNPSTSQEQGLAIVSADSSLFSNGMLWHGDNAIAAIRVSNLLCDSRKRQLAFIADGQTLRSYRSRDASTSLPPAEPPDAQRKLPEPELQKALRLANAIAKEVAESNVLNEALRQRPRNVQPALYFRALLAMMAIAFVIASLAFVLTNGRLRAAILPVRPMRAAYELSEYSKSDPDDYRNAAGLLAREFCFELSGSRNSGDWQQVLSVSADRPMSLNASEQQKLSRIVDIACRGCHSKLTRLEFQLFGKSLSQLRAKHSDHSRPLAKDV